MGYRTVEENIAFVQGDTHTYLEWCECMSDAMEHAGMALIPSPYELRTNYPLISKDILLTKIYWLLVQKESQP